MHKNANDLTMNNCGHQTSMNDYEQLWTFMNDYEQTLNIYEWMWTTMNVCKWLWMILNMNDHEWLWTIVNIEWTWIIMRFLNDIYEQFMNMNRKRSMSENKKWSISENEKQSMKNEWFENDQHLGKNCTFSIKLILCIPWVTTFPPLSVPTNLEFKSIFLVFNVEAQVHPESSASQPIL